MGMIEGNGGPYGHFLLRVTLLLLSVFDFWFHFHMYISST